MSYKNTKFRFIAQLMLVLFITNNTAPTLQFAFADSTQYYVDATTGNDLNDGLTPGTAWQTVAQVNSTPLLQGDTVSFLCTDTWNEILTINNTNGSTLLPITVNSYGVSCGTNKPKLDGINITNSSEINITNVDIPTPTVGNSVNIGGSNTINFTNSTITNGSGICLNITNSTGATVIGNNFSGCDYGVNINASEVNLSTNIFSTIAQDALTISSAFPVVVSQNTFTNIAQNAIIYGQDTDITQNDFTNTCSTGSTHCAAIKNNAALSGATVTSTISQNTISGVGSGISGTGSYGILAYNVAGVTVDLNSVINAENALRIIDANTLTITNNNFLTSRAKSILVTQENLGLTHTNTFNTNTILQKNPDYPYIEMRDEVDGSNQSSTFLTANANTIYPNYKPNTSYVRSVDFGGYTNEYSKNMLDQFDPSVVKFEYFAYRPYTNTGSFATANLITNPNFDTDASGWSVGAEVGLAPVLTHNPVGSNFGGSATITPSGGSSDRIWLTSDDVLNITAGQTYLVTGYARSSSGNINLRAFLHQSGNHANVYSDRIAETYATATGGIFSFYITTKSTAADANITFETSNQNVNLEVDNMSIRRMNAVIKNTNSQETVIFSNTGAVSYDQSCPGGACFAYVDGVNASISWPTAIPAYSTRFVLLNNSPNILNTPTIVLNISAGSVPTGQPVTIDWTTTNADSQILNYSTYTGSISTPVASVGSETFIPPYDTNSTITIDAINDVGPRQASIQVTTTNTSPSIFPTTTIGFEDALQIDGTMSGVDLNPGDTVTFETFGGNNVVNGVLTYDSSGSLQYYPNPDFCGTDDFSFRAADQLGHQADPVNHTIQVDCVNDTPVAVNDSGSAFAGIPILIDVLVNDTDVDTLYEAQTFTISGISIPSNGTLSINSNQLEYTPNLGFSGTDVFSYSMSDQSGALSNTGTVTMTVTISNTPPTVVGTGYTLNEDSSLVSTLTGSDNEGDPLTYTASTLPVNGTLVLLANGSFTYTPTSDYFGSDSFDFIANDGLLNSAPATVTLTIDPILDAPTTVADSYSLSQDTTFFVPVMMNDIDPDSVVLTLTGYTNPTNGTLVVSGTGFDYTPNTGYIGPDSFTYQLIDDTSLTSNISTATLNVTTTNTPPIANSGSLSLNEDGTLSGALTGTDLEGSTLTFIIDTPPSQGAFSVSSTGAFIYTPATNYNGSDSIVFHVSDGMYDSSGATIDITINSVNDTPVANAASFTATGNSLASSGYIFNGVLSASDIESVGLSFTTATLPTHGIFSLTSTGVFSYIPALGYTGPDNFTFTASDGSATSTSATVNITVVSNGVVLPQTLDNFTISAPSTAYLGQTFSISVQARDSSSIIFSGYTGSIVFASPTDTGATLPGSGSPIVFSALDGGVKSFINGVSFTKTGTMTFNIQDGATGISASSVITISIAPPPIISSSSGPGAGGGGGQTSPAVTYNVVSVTNSGDIAKIPTAVPANPTTPLSEEDPNFNSAPVGQFETIFVMDDPTGLLGQLFLTNRYMGESAASLPSDSLEIDSTVLNNQAALDIIDSLDMLILDDIQGPVILRQIARLFSLEVSRSDDPIGLYEYATAKIEQIQVPEDTRLAFTREYILRIFEQQRKRYEDEIYRIAYTGFEDTMNSASDEIGGLDF